mmetsp:Transcript_18986/g.29239  ORF Transcript_18986/g.29239 Transcript_18986/m.29239 type:complete len:80 (-) Transcript_18986:160-399(-)
MDNVQPNIWTRESFMRSIAVVFPTIISRYNEICGTFNFQEDRGANIERHNGEKRHNGATFLNHTYGKICCYYLGSENDR